MTQFHKEHQQVFGYQQNVGNNITSSNQSLTLGKLSNAGIPLPKG
jgi:hypothetical protein